MNFTKLGRMVFSRFLVVGWTILIAGVLNIAQAQYIPPPAPPPPPPVFNPSPSNTAVPQPSYQSISPTTPSTGLGSGGTSPEVTSPANESLPSTATRAHRRTSVGSHYHRGRFAGVLGFPRYCGYSPCVRIYRLASYGYAGPASGLWWPGYYDYAPGQFSREVSQVFGISRGLKTPPPWTIEELRCLLHRDGRWRAEVGLRLFRADDETAEQKRALIARAVAV